MNKGLLYLSITIGGVVGSYLPVVLFHAGELSGWSIICGGLGSLAGIWLAWKLSSGY